MSEGTAHGRDWTDEVHNAYAIQPRLWV